MTNLRMIYCTISIVLSLLAITLLWHYVWKDYQWLSIIVILIIVRLNVYIFTPKKSISNL